jgi:hypothetical protein
MFYTNTSTLFLLHEDRVKRLQKMHEPLPFLSILTPRFWGSPSLEQPRARPVKQEKHNKTNQGEKHGVQQSVTRALRPLSLSKNFWSGWG